MSDEVRPDERSVFILVNIDYNIFLVFIFTIKSIARDEVKTSLNKNECKNHMSAKREYRLSHTSALMYIYFFNRQH